MRYREGAIWWLQDPELIAMAEEAQAHVCSPMPGTT